MPLFLTKKNLVLRVDEHETLGYALHNSVVRSDIARCVKAVGVKGHWRRDIGALDSTVVADIEIDLAVACHAC